jgi:hypothetical protein
MATPIEQAEALAKRAAAGFVREFGEPLDPAETDWDGMAWSLDVGAIRTEAGERLEPDQVDALWPAYQAALVAETRRLCGGHRHPDA